MNKKKPLSSYLEEFDKKFINNTQWRIDEVGKWLSLTIDYKYIKAFITKMYKELR